MKLTTTHHAGRRPQGRIAMLITLGAVAIVGAAILLRQPDSTIDGSADSAATGTKAPSTADIPPPQVSAPAPPIDAIPSPPDRTEADDLASGLSGSDRSAGPGIAGSPSRRLIIPVAGVRARDLLDTYSDARAEGRTHNAIDIMAPLGAPVLAAAPGRIIKLFQSDRGGITLYQLDRDSSHIYYYAHLSGYAPGIGEGRWVLQGDTIAYVGDTGNAAPGNYHLHFEIMATDDPSRFWDGTPINPYPLLMK